MIRRELLTFLVVGSLTVLIDYVAYFTLTHISLVGTDIAKAIGFLTGTLFAYFANKLWTFSHAPLSTGSAPRFVLLYTLTLGANVIINTAALHMLWGSFYAVQVAFIIATTVSAALNFIGMKFFVFRAPRIIELK